MNDDPIVTQGFQIFNPKPTWKWDMFGGQQMVVTMTEAQPSPSWFARLMTKLLFGSLWTRL